MAHPRLAEARPIADHGHGAARDAGGSAERLVRARGGDAESWAELVREHRGDVTRLCRRLLGSAEEAEDAAQECFLRAHAAIASYDPEQPFRRWLLAIAAHRAIDALRRRRREARLFDSDAPEADRLPAAGPTPLEHGLASELREALLRAIESQPDRYRAPLVLRYYAGLEYEHVAEILGVSRNQVATLLFRGRRRLRTALEDLR